MRISVKTTNEVKVLAFEGSLDTGTSPGAQQQLTRLIEAGETKILVNLETVKAEDLSAGFVHVRDAARQARLTSEARDTAPTAENHAGFSLGFSECVVENERIRFQAFLDEFVQVQIRRRHQRFVVLP